jgi:hypothetical protein
MPISPNTPTGVKVDVNLREHLSFNPASQETIQRTNLAKTFLEDYYKQMPSRPPTKVYVHIIAVGYQLLTNGSEEEQVPEDDKKKVKKSSSGKKIKGILSKNPKHHPLYRMSPATQTPSNSYPYCTIFNCIFNHFLIFINRTKGSITTNYASFFCYAPCSCWVCERNWSAGIPFAHTTPF